MPPHPGEELPFPHDDPGLGAAQEFVAAETDHRRAGLDALRHHRLVGQAEGRGVQERPASQIVHHRDPVALPQGHQFRQGDLGHEADHAEIAVVGAEDQGDVLSPGEGLLIIPQMGPVRGADLDEARAALGHHLRDAESAADFDELAPGDQHPAPPSQGGEGEEHSRGVVVDHQGGLGPGQPAQEILHRRLPFPSLAGLQVELQIAVSRRGADGFEGRAGEGRAAQIRMQDHAGGVDDGAGAGGMPAGQPGCGLPEQRRLQRRGLTLLNPRPRFRQDLPERFDHRVMAESRQERRRALRFQQAIHTRQRSTGIHPCLAQTHGLAWDFIIFPLGE
ncbi:hypothetical protein HRbin22_02166 [Candidatus Thermoflexus japonica]|uniref:Uncharacterized protein n=1 Tax=Candidatus Thermoflexus japonica TaxID=2035417 RepID=A0A2H5Y8X3_9CHLR|nr:hypothetical protein HRbin22_02166 [Candidatus Thermoflexus japonica]